MSGRPSDGMDLDELRDEFDWMYEFQSRMAERIRGDADVHNLVDYVGKLEDENAKLREELEAAKHDLSLFSSVLVASKFENAKLRELVRDYYIYEHRSCHSCHFYDECHGVGYESRAPFCIALIRLHDRMRELGVEVNGGKRMSDADATQARQDVVADVEEILEHVINANMLSMPYDVYSELFDAVDGLGGEIEILQSENAMLREDLEDLEGYDQMLRDRLRQQTELCVKAEAENAKLREELAKARDPQRIGWQADPSSFVYAIEQLREFRWQHATNDEDAIPYINNVAAAHERENAKLRELLLEVWRSCPVYEDDCKRCPHYMGESDYWCDIPIRMEALGIEVS